MIDKRTEVELKLHDVVRDILYGMEKGQLKANEFRDLVGRLRDIRVMLDNKQFGCMSGRHSAACKCI
jgi:hypothetical protein